jgi:hypothetical protein
MINRLSSRVFIMHDINLGAPIVFESRWAMSYLRGPLTKPQINELMKTRIPKTSPEATTRSSIASTDIEFSQAPTTIDPKITQVYISDPIMDQSTAFNQATPNISTNQIMYEPRLMAKSSITYYDKKLGVDLINNFVMLLPSTEFNSGWEKALRIPADKIRFSNNPKQPASFRSIPNEFNTYAKIQSYGRSLPDYLHQNSRLKIYSHKDLGVTQKQDEDDRAFAIRLRDAAREKRDSEVQKIQRDYESKIGKVEDKIRSLQMSLQSDQQEVEARKREEYLGAGATVLGFFIGRKNVSGITATSRRMRMTAKAQSDVLEGQRKIADLNKDVDELETELREAVEKVTNRWDNVLNETTLIEVKPSRVDIKIDLLALAWVVPG